MLSNRVAGYAMSSFHQEFAMGKTFWVVVCVFGLGLFTSVFVAYAIEEYRWQRVVENVEQLNHNTQEYVAAIDRLVESLPAAVAAGEKMKEGDLQRQEYEALKEEALNMITKRHENPKRLWRVVPGLLEFFDRERKTNFRNLLFSVLTLALAVFVATAAVKTKKRFSKEVAELAKQRGEVGHSNANLVERERKLLRDQDRLAADSAALEKLREEFEKEQRKFRRQVLKFQHQQPKPKTGDQLVGSEKGDGDVSEGNGNMPAVVRKEVPPTLAPWTFLLAPSKDDDGKPLPQERDGFIAALESALGKVKLRSLKAKRVYASLFLLVEHLQRNQGIGQVGYTKLAGWKKWRVGKRHRLYFRRVGEYEILFLPPVQRKDAYRR